MTGRMMVSLGCIVMEKLFSSLKLCDNDIVNDVTRKAISILHCFQWLWLKIKFAVLNDMFGNESIINFGNCYSRSLSSEHLNL